MTSYWNLTKYDYECTIINVNIQNMLSYVRVNALNKARIHIYDKQNFYTGE